MTVNIPVVMSAAGAVPTPPADLRAQLIALVTVTNPGYTANLPGSLIEDVSSTEVGGLSLLDQARVDTINSLTPYGANLFLLQQLGSLYGVPPNPATFTSVNVVFTGPVGLVIQQGFVVSDGTHQYVLQEGGLIKAGGTTDALFAVAIVSGTWTVPISTVGTLVTSIPSTVGPVTVTNPEAGVPGQDAETPEAYRSRVVQAGQAIAQGMPTFLKTQLAKVSGVQVRLISVRQTSAGWEVICGGGDPYDVAYAIFRSVFNIPSLVGSTINVLAFTKANPGVVTTDLNHGFTNGQVVTIAGSNPSAWNGTYTATVIDQKTFSVGVDTSARATYVGSGVATPNSRNAVVTVKDTPDTYNIPFVKAPQQLVTMTVTWNTTSTNVVSPAAVAQLAAAPLVAYVNSIVVGQPMNVFRLQEIFAEAVASVLPNDLLTRLVFAVAINGIGTAPSSGTGIISGDPESYFFAQDTAITVVQG